MGVWDTPDEINFEMLPNNRSLTLEHVRQAVKRSKAIMQKNSEKGYVLQQYKGYRYYRENPSLSVWEIIEKILHECHLTQ